MAIFLRISNMLDGIMISPFQLKSLLGNLRGRLGGKGLFKEELDLASHINPKNKFRGRGVFSKNIVSLKEYIKEKEDRRGGELVEIFNMLETNFQSPLAQVPNSFFFRFGLKSNSVYCPFFEKFVFYAYLVSLTAEPDEHVPISYRHYRKNIKELILNEIEARKGNLRRNFSCTLGQFFSSNYFLINDLNYSFIPPAEQKSKVIYLKDYSLASQSY